MIKPVTAVLLLATLFLGASDAMALTHEGEATPPPILVGGYRDQSPADPAVVAAAEFAVTSEASKQGVTMSLVSVERAQAQVVAGINYKLDLTVEVDGKSKNVTAVIYRDLSDTYAVSSWQASCLKTNQAVNEGQ